jgi:hypothetical protein
VSTLSSPTARLAGAGRRRKPIGSLQLRLRLRVLVRGRQLERLLIEGADPVSAPELALRAFQLTRASHRRSLAASLDDALLSAANGRRRSPSAAPLAGASIAAARPALVELARMLREQPVVAARGVAMTRRLLVDGAGPLYVDTHDGALRHAAEQALTALSASA